MKRFYIHCLLLIGMILSGEMAIAAFHLVEESPTNEASADLIVNSFGDHQTLDHYFRPASSGTRKENKKRDFIEIEEEKDERERTSSKKQYEISSYHTPIYYTELPGNYFTKIKKSLILKNHQRYLLSLGPDQPLNILFDVFRI